MYKFTTISTLCVAAWMSTGCQTTTPTLSPKDPEKAIQVRTQLAAEYLKSGDLDSAKRALDQALETDSRLSLIHI